MNKKIFTVLMFYTISGYAASDDPVITKPYKPSFRDRYNTQCKAALTVTGALGAAYAYTHRRTSLDKTSCAVLGGASLAWLHQLHRLHQMKKNRRLVDMLLIQPKSVLDRSHEIREQGAKEIKGMPETRENTKKLLEKYTKKWPIFLLGECVQEDWGHCVLSRVYEPNYRQQFESRVVTSLHSKLQSLPRPTQYVSFGSGGLFQDHVILTKTLAKKPDAQLDVHLIDLKHTPYAHCRDLLDNTRSVDSHISTDPVPVMSLFKKVAREKEWVAKTMGDEELTSVLVNECEGVEVPAQQSLTWLKKTFPNARLNVYLHDTADSYQHYIERTHAQSPDVIVAADIEDEMSLLQSACPHYVQLCVRAQQKNTHADNLWLTKNRKKGLGELTSLKLTESPGATKEEVQVKGASIPVYVTSQQIPATSLLRRISGR